MLISQVSLNLLSIQLQIRHMLLDNFPNGFEANPEILVNDEIPQIRDSPESYMRISIREIYR